jgi:RIO-like serine/threonine protein kinase
MKKVIFQKFAEKEVGGFDRIVHHKDGTFSFKRGFFYRHGMTAEKYAEMMCVRLKEARVEFQFLESIEDWNPWPKDSWFVARFKILEY